MAIVSVKTRLGYDYEYSLGKLAPRRIFNRYFWVYSDTRDEDPVTVRTAAGLPQVGDVSPSDGGSIVQSVRVRRDEDRPDRWEAEVQYSSELIRDVEDEEPETLADLEHIQIGTRQGDRLIERRLDGSMTLNSAGDPIEGLTMPWNALQMTIEQYVTGDPDYYVLSKWVNAINSATWRSVPQYFAQIAAINLVEAKSPIDGSDCWKRTVNVILAHTEQNPYGFRLHVLDAGLREKVSGKLSHIRSPGNMALVGKPVPLNGSGSPLPLGGTPVYLDVNPYPILDFATLGI